MGAFVGKSSEKNKKQKKTKKRNKYYVKERTDMTQEDSRCILGDDRDETINNIIRKCSKLMPKEYKMKHDWIG